MPQKKKLPTTGRSAKSASGKKAARKTAAAKTSGRRAAKPAARKTVTKAAASAKGKKPAARKVSVSAATAKSRAKSARGKAVAATRSTKLAAKKPAAKKGAAAAKAAPARAVAAAVKPAAQRITASVAEKAAPTAKAPSAATPKSIAEKAAAARQLMAAKRKPVNQRHGFKANDFVVYPAHGVGRIIGIEEQEIAGIALELFVINFDKEKLTLRVPTGKLESVGMRKLSEDGIVKKAMDTLKGRARVKRTMWSRRAQEYVAKINSGDLVSIAEVVRDLYRSEAQPEQSYSERQLYEDALDRMAREIAAVEKLDERGAVQRITDVLSKSARGRRLAAESSDGDGDESRAA